MGAQLSLKAAMPLAEIPATSRKNASNRLADAKASPNHSQAPRQKLPAKNPLVLTS